MQSVFPADQLLPASANPSPPSRYSFGNAVKPNVSEIMIGLQNCRVFQGLLPHALTEIAEACSARNFARGEVVYKEADFPDSCLLISKGRVKKFHQTPEGKHSILGFVDSNQLLGFTEVVHGQNRNETAEAMEKTTAVVIPRNTVLHAMQNHPEVCRRLLEMVCSRVQNTENRIKSMLFRSSRDRLVSLLEELASRYGKQTQAGTLIDQKFSHQDLANLIGATRETVTITLGELQTEDLISVERRRITLRTQSQLADLPDPSSASI